MKTIEQYKNPHDALDEFAQELSFYTQAPYVVLTDSCTHAIELCLRYWQSTTGYTGTIICPARTYLSVPQVIAKLGYKFELDTYYDWMLDGEYRLSPTPVWDSARKFSRGMYRGNEQFQCVSFGHSKALEIGHGGAILLDDEQAYNTLKRMAYDGRDLSFDKWPDQKVFEIGYHYHMRPEDAVRGINMMMNNEIKAPETQVVLYPDLTELEFRF